MTMTPLMPPLMVTFIELKQSTLPPRVMDIAFIALIFGAIGAVAGTLDFLRGAYQDSFKNLVEQLKDPRDRDRCIKELSRETHWRIRYSLALLRLNTFIGRVYAQPTSFNAFDRSLVFTIIYPFTLYLIAWMLGSSNRVGELVFFGDYADGRERMSVALGYLLLLMAGTAAIRALPMSEELFVFGKVSAFKFYGAREWIRFAAMLACMLITWYLSQRLTGVGYAISFAVYFLYCSSLYFAWRALLSRQKRAAPIISILLALSLAFTTLSVWWTGLGTGSIAFLVLFFLLLPIVNAAFDFVSWVVTRWFLNLASEGAWSAQRIPSLARGLTIDVVWAALCLQLLAVCILGAYLAHDLMFPAHKVFWEAQLTAFGTASSSGTLLLVGMLMTTLIPTAIHLAVGLSGLALAWLPQTDLVVQYLSGDTPTASNLHRAATSILWLRVGVYVAFPLVAIVLCSLPWLVGPYIEGPVYGLLRLLFGR